MSKPKKSPKKRKAASLLGGVYDSDDDANDAEEEEEDGGEGPLGVSMQEEKSEESDDDAIPMGALMGKLLMPDAVTDDHGGPLVVDERGVQGTQREIANYINAGGKTLPVFVSMYGIEGDFSLEGMNLIPPPPREKCFPELQQKIATLTEEAKKRNMTFNQTLQSHKEFHNPYILEKIARQYDIDPDGTNYPDHLYDQNFIDEKDLYTELAIQQKQMEARHEMEAQASSSLKEAPKSMTAPAPPLTKTVSSSSLPGLPGRTRRNKWDAPAPVAPAVPASKPALLPALNSAQNDVTAAVEKAAQIAKAKALSRKR
eukprot:g30673.t1